MRIGLSTLLAAALLLLLPGCRKETDTEAPTIRFIAPGEAFVLSIPDSLTVSVEVSDEQGVKSVWIGLTDVNGVPIAPARSITLDTRSTTVTRTIAVTDERILSGTYTITVRASDGVNERRAFRSVQVLEAPLRLRAVYLTPSAASAPSTLYRVDSTGSIAPWHTQSDISGAVAHGKQQYVVVAGGATAPLQGLPTSSQGSPWQVPNFSALGEVYFLGLCRDQSDDRIYFGTSDGQIKGFTAQGAQTFSANALPGYRSRRLLVLGDRLLSAEYSVNTSERRLVPRAYGSGDAFALFTLDLDVLGMDRLTDQRALLIGTRDGLGVVAEFFLASGSVNDQRTFSEGPVLAAVRINADTWALSLPGRVVRYTRSSNSIAQLSTGTQYTSLAFDQANGVLYGAAGNVITLFSPSTGNVSGTIVAPEDIGGIHPLLNR
ncbi:MAG: hypothetical protein KF905_14330 [Flavobacteriales bacterium]|nr:hypothetical protein [Flavobacteriales bacterium]